MITKELIFYFVRKTRKGFKKEWQDKLKGTKIIIHDDILHISPVKGKAETLGVYSKCFELVEFYLLSMRGYVSREPDVYKALRMIESVVEHELLHAVGLNHENIKGYREGKLAVDKS